MKTFKLLHGVEVIVAWDGVTLSQDSEIISLRWEDWDEMTKSVEKLRKCEYLR